MKKILSLLTILVAFTASTAFGAVGTGSIKTVPSLADLKLVTPSTTTPFVYVLGLSTAGDGFSGLYTWNASSSLTTNYAVVASTIGSASAGQWVRSPGSKQARVQTLVAATAVQPESRKIKVAGTSGATTLTSTPQVSTANAKDGDIITIQGTSDTDTVVFTDEGGATGSKLQLGGATRTLGVGDTLTLTYDSTTGYWYEVSFTNN